MSDSEPDDEEISRAEQEPRLEGQTLQGSYSGEEEQNEEAVADKDSEE